MKRRKLSTQDVEVASSREFWPQELKCRSAGRGLEILQGSLDALGWSWYYGRRIQRSRVFPREKRIRVRGTYMRASLERRFRLLLHEKTHVHQIEDWGALVFLGTYVTAEGRFRIEVPGLAAEVFRMAFLGEDTLAWEDAKIKQLRRPGIRGGYRMSPIDKNNLVTEVSNIFLQARIDGAEQRGIKIVGATFGA